MYEHLVDIDILRIPFLMFAKRVPEVRHEVEVEHLIVLEDPLLSYLLESICYTYVAGIYVS